MCSLCFSKIQLQNSKNMDLISGYNSDDDVAEKEIPEEPAKPTPISELIPTAAPQPPPPAKSSSTKYRATPACTEDGIDAAKSATAIVQMVRESLQIGAVLTFKLKTKAMLGIVRKSTTKTRAEWQTHTIVKDLVHEVKTTISAIVTLEDVYKLDEVTVCETIHAISKLAPREPIRAIALRIFNLAEAVHGRNPLHAKSMCYLAHATKDLAICEEALRRKTCNIALVAQVAPKDLMPLVLEKLMHSKIEASAEELSTIIKRMPHAFMASSDSNALLEAAVRKRSELENMGTWEGIQQLMEKTRRKDFDSLLPELRADRTYQKRNARGELKTVQQFHTQDGHTKRRRGDNPDFERPSPARRCADTIGSSY
eukprot:GEMP01060171.1.p1 GENE.GEMP01060171.1~~GEMP01060171.1.p1  ORF type:complete len:369 (+),score=76.05 GEMP01060171.1:2-1108(+)